MKWKNIDIGASYYYITGTVTEWLPLLDRADIRNRVCDDIRAALEACGGWLVAWFGRETNNLRRCSPPVFRCAKLSLFHSPP